MPLCTVDLIVNIIKCCAVVYIGIRYLLYCLINESCSVAAITDMLRAYLLFCRHHGMLMLLAFIFMSGIELISQLNIARGRTGIHHPGVPCDLLRIMGSYFTLEIVYVADYLFCTALPLLHVITPPTLYLPPVVISPYLPLLLYFHSL